MSAIDNNILESLPNQDTLEVSGTVAQVEPIIPESEKPADFNTHQSSDSNGQIRRAQDSTDEDEGLGPAKEDEKPSEDKLKTITAVKLILFELMTKVLGVFVSFFTMGFGYENMGHCPANFYLPYVVYAIGIMGLFIVSYAVLKTDGEDFESLQKNERKVIEVSSVLLAFLWLLELLQFFTMDVSFNSSAENYCDHRFYIFTIFMNIFLALGFFVGYSLLYLDPDVFNRADANNPRGAHEWMFDSSDSD